MPLKLTRFLRIAQTMKIRNSTIKKQKKKQSLKKYLNIGLSNLSLNIGNESQGQNDIKDFVSKNHLHLQISILFSIK